MLTPTSILAAGEAVPEATQSRLVRLLRGELNRLRPRLLLVQLLITLLPRETFGWLRTACYRLAGIRIGRRTRILGKLEFGGDGDVVRNLLVGEGCALNTPSGIMSSSLRTRTTWAMRRVASGIASLDPCPSRTVHGSPRG